MTSQLERLQPAAVSRRTVLKGAGAVTGLVLCLRTSGSLAQDEPVQMPPRKVGAEDQPGGTVDNPLVFVAIGEDDIVTITVHRPEMGQGIRTSLAMVVAEELEADWAKVRVTQAPADEARYGAQNTDASRSMRHFFAPMRRVGAAARAMLETAAAARWKVPVADVEARSNEVVHVKTDRRLSFGALTKDAARVPVPPREKLRLKDPKNFRYIGKGKTHLIDGADMVAGSAMYGIDTRLDGMLHAVIARPPVAGGKLAEYDASAALKIPGVVRVVELKTPPPPFIFNPLGGVAVVASNTWAALKGREVLKLRWEDGPNGQYDSEEFKKTLESIARQPAQAARSDGDAVAALAKATKKIEAEYYMPHLAHATMEPPAATARIKDGKCEVWAPVQSPQETRVSVAANMGMKFDDVTIHVTLMGGGFGRKCCPDYAAEAALVSKAMDGTPVKVTWTREDDLRSDYHHTVTLERLEGALDEQGKPIAWLHRSASPTITSTFLPGYKKAAPYEIGMGAIGVPYQIPNLRLEMCEVSAYTRIGWFRSVANLPHAFAIQSFVSELAAAAGRDPKDYLLELIGPPRLIDTRTQNDPWNDEESPDLYKIDTARLRNVVELAAREAQWGRKLPKGHGLGVAATYSFCSYAAAVVEVQVSDAGELTIQRVDMAFDCGPQVNPDRVRAQVEGSAIMGISVATTGEITFKNGRVGQSNFHDFRVARMNEVPRELHVHLVPHTFDVLLGGVGEPAIPPVAPAICNAIFAATGKRIRRLPIRDQLRV